MSDSMRIVRDEIDIRPYVNQAMLDEANKVETLQDILIDVWSYGFALGWEAKRHAK